MNQDALRIGLVFLARILIDRWFQSMIIAQYHLIWNVLGTNNNAVPLHLEADIRENKYVKQK